MKGSARFDEVRDRLVSLAGDGLTLPDSCLQAGVPEETVKTWLKKGRRGDEPYATFASELDAARDQAALAAGPLDEDELLLEASKAARKGSVQAMRLVWNMLRAAAADEADNEPDELDAIDQLVARRFARQ